LHREGSPINAFARALGAARSGNAAGARQAIERLHALHQVLTERKLAYWAEQTEVQAKVASAWALLAEGKKEEALAAMRAAADHEDQTEKHAVTPGPIMPARELLGDMLLECPFRTLFWNSEAILPELLKGGEAELATDAFIPHNHLFL